MGLTDSIFSFLGSLCYVSTIFHNLGALGMQKCRGHIGFILFLLWDPADPSAWIAHIRCTALPSYLEIEHHYEIFPKLKWHEVNKQLSLINRKILSIPRSPKSPFLGFFDTLGHGLVVDAHQKLRWSRGAHTTSSKLWGGCWDAECLPWGRSPAALFPTMTACCKTNTERTLYLPPSSLFKSKNPFHISCCSWKQVLM